MLGTYEGSRRDAAGVRRRGREGVGGSNGPSAAVREGRVGLAAAVEGRGGGSGGEGVEERCIRRLGVAVRESRRVRAMSCVNLMRGVVGHAQHAITSGSTTATQ